MNKYLKKWVVVNVNDIAVYGTFDTQEEAGQWIFDYVISVMWEPEECEGVKEERAWIEFDTDYAVYEILDK